MRVWRRHSKAKGGVNNERQKQIITELVKVELPVPYRICAETSQRRRGWKTKGRDRAENAKIERAKGSREKRSRGVSRSHPYARRHSTMSAAQFTGYLEGKSSLMILERHANLKYKYRSRHFWRRGYCVNTDGRNKNANAE